MQCGAAAASSRGVRSVVPLHITAGGDAQSADARSASPLPLGRLCEPPLRRVSSFLSDSNESPSVTVRLAEPFWGSWAHVDMLVHCVQLHSLLEQEIVDANSAPRQLDEICTARPRVRELLDALYTDAETLRPGAGPMPLLDETGLSPMCPLVPHFLGDPDKVRVRRHPPAGPPLPGHGMH